MPEAVLLGHGGGGRLMQELIADCLGVLGPANGLDQPNDAACLELPSGERLAFTTDSFVVSPLSFPGGDVGRLAVCGTVNDLAAMGAQPLGLSLGLVIEEGLQREALAQIIASIRNACEEAGTRILTGDTKVVERGAADGLFINTSGVGLIAPGVLLGGERARAGDRVIVNGPLADHALAILAAREELPLQGDFHSDCAPLNDLTAAVLEAGGNGVRALRDLTRGGLAAALNEIARQSHAHVQIVEGAVPVRPAAKAACDLLGHDPLSMANEGKLVALVAPDRADDVLAAMQAHALGREAAIVGEVKSLDECRVTARTALGPTRIVDLPSGELLPRIC
ncbi:MAG: hydrogenase expression/formation protein HypE [Armatimonadetes bacterium]|nr:hydrogenase expression/formation protein HypE [Armatimonadota bacterium]